MSLTVPIPELTVEGISDHHFVAEKPINLRCAAVTFPDGSKVSPEHAQQFGFRLFRNAGGGTLEVWNEADKAWVSETAEPEPEPLAFQEEYWQNVLVAMGQIDQGGQDKFASDRLAGIPTYHIRCLFIATDTDGVTHQGVSPPSADFTVYTAGELDRAGLTMVPKESTSAETIRLYLKDAALLSEQGVIAIRQDGGGFEIALSVSGASVILNSAGDIALAPAGGRRVEIEGDVNVAGDLEVQHQLSVQGHAQLQGGVTVNGAMDVTGTVAILGSLSVNGVSVG